MKNDVKISHYSDVRGLSTFTFDQLTDGAKVVARNSTIQVEVNAYLRDLNVHNNKPMHVRINGHSFSNLLDRKLRLNVLLSDPIKYDSTILSNVCHFLSDGTYVVYSLNDYKL